MSGFDFEKSNEMILFFLKVKITLLLSEWDRHKRWKPYTDQRECDTLERIQRVQEGVTEDVAWRYATDKVRMINEQNFSVLKVPFQKIKTASKLHK